MENLKAHGELKKSVVSYVCHAKRAMDLLRMEGDDRHELDTVIRNSHPDINVIVGNLATNTVRHFSSCRLYLGDVDFLKTLKNHLNDEKFLLEHKDKVTVFMKQVTLYCISPKHCRRPCKFVIKAIFAFIVGYCTLLEKIKCHRLLDVLRQDYGHIAPLVRFYHSQDVMKQVFPKLISGDYLVLTAHPGHFTSTDRFRTAHADRNDAMEFELDDYYYYEEEEQEDDFYYDEDDAISAVAGAMRKLMRTNSSESVPTSASSRAALEVTVPDDNVMDLGKLSLPEILQRCKQRVGCYSLGSGHSLFIQEQFLLDDKPPGFYPGVYFLSVIKMIIPDVCARVLDLI